MKTQPTALRLADALDADATNGDMGRKPDSKCHKRQASTELRRLHEVLQSIGVIAHCGGLAGMSEGEALIAIRKISSPYWNKNSSIAQNRAAIAKGENT